MPRVTRKLEYWLDYTKCRHIYISQLLCTYNAGQYFVGHIWQTLQSIASCSDIVEKGPISVFSSTWNNIGININTVKGWSTLVTWMITTFCHKVSIVFPGPWRWTASFSRNHDHYSSDWNIAYSTWDIKFWSCRLWRGPLRLWYSAPCIVVEKCGFIDRESLM